MENNYPIIGILSQKTRPICEKLDDKFKDCTSFIAASYVKFIESSGARVVPIFIGQEKQYYENILSKINGVLLPGGAEWFDPEKEVGGYAEAGRHIYDIAKVMNNNKVHFPIFGICLGFELLLYLSAGEEHRDKCENLGKARNATFKEGFKKHRMFANMPDRVVDSFSNRSVANHYHRFCETEATLEVLKMDQVWKVSMIGKDDAGVEFINAIESEEYPFYGVQFHPEKSAFEWRSNYVSHTAYAIEANRYFADFFISESRKNNQKFENKEDESEYLIYNYEIANTGKNGGKYEQCYVFRHPIYGQQKDD